jgi:hypothetical protein
MGKNMECIAKRQTPFFCFAKMTKYKVKKEPSGSASICTVLQEETARRISSTEDRSVDTRINSPEYS